MVAARSDGTLSHQPSKPGCPHKDTAVAVLKTVVTEVQKAGHRDLLESIIQGISQRSSLEQKDEETVRRKSTAARLRSLLHPVATAWLKVLPSGPTMRMDDKEFLAALWHHFGVVLPPSQAHIRYDV